MNGFETGPVPPFALFLIGMMLQAFYLLFGRWEKGDLRMILYSFAGGLLGMMPGEHETDYDLPLHLFLSCVTASIFFVFNFRKRLLVRIDGQMLIVWSLLFFAILVNHYGLNWSILGAVAIFSLPTLVNGFSDIDRNFKWQVFFYVWFIVMVVAIGFTHFNLASMGVFNGSIGSTVSALELLFSGAAFFFLVINAWYVLYLVPIPLNKHQTMRSRMYDVHEQLHLLASGYMWNKDDIRTNLMLIVALPAFFVCNYLYQLVSEEMLISLSFVVMASLNRKTEQSSDEDYEQETDWKDRSEEISIWTTELVSTKVMHGVGVFWVVAMLVAIVLFNLSFIRSM